ncbi:OmpP1/FadL family transporter [Agrobacterium rosae]|uniref:Long-chain fatty acid transporter n=1 Tax=Agrobacterium rosae TaxID=1972867 RepID=A0AAE5RZ97_9HYPH|nr:OmpP1/FadL family transporter [Agrobacterium rosae]KAA3512110.1 transporter [Agrobacterium rosae]KAA3520442.1 transporter [Agrobacterium rosae]MCM2432339.1 transporter [Agrobacterium rosae]MDX8331296.1 OmpP1/FadL family transporter [Agrobacterium rosae]MQB48707.1 transporter [Agrobacterium rosae]
MATQNHFISGALGLAIGITSITPAFAGGLERGGYNIDLLFDSSRFAAESTATFVAPQRKLKNVTGAFPGSTTADDTENYWVPRIGLKAGFGDAIDCMADYSQPWGAHTKPGNTWAGRGENIETKVDSDNYALTCSYKFDVGKGQLRFIGGGFYQELSGFKERQVTPAGGGGTGVGRLDLEGDGWGWRAGVAYEIPEYALRASLVYNSAVKLDDITGTLNLSQVAALGGPVVGVHGSQDMPDSLELKFQTGIAPGWLALGSVKWTDWSQFTTIPFYCNNAVLGLCSAGGRGTSLDLGYRDGWTVSGGVGHKFNDQWSGAVTVTWDRGTSEGFGTQTDTWTLGAGVQHALTENVELRVAGAIGLLTSGSSRPITSGGVVLGNGVSYDFGNDIVAAVSTSLKVKF